MEEEHGGDGGGTDISLCKVEQSAFQSPTCPQLSRILVAGEVLGQSG